MSDLVYTHSDYAAPSTSDDSRNQTPNPMLNSEVPSRPAGASGTLSVATVIYIATAALIDLVLAATIGHVYHTPGYRAVANMLCLLIWAGGTSIVCTAFIFTCSRRLKPSNYLIGLFASDLVASLLPFVLIRCLRFGTTENRSLAFGAVYAMFLYSKGGLLAWCAIKRAIDGSSTASSGWRLFTTCLIIFSAMSPWLAFRVSLTGDEPHYLILTHSLIKDHDFDLSNNYDRRDYLAFYPALLAHHTVRNSRGEEMPIHDLGLSLLLIPGYIAGGRLGVMLEMNLLAALIAVASYALSFELSGRGPLALAYTYLFFFSSPLSYFSSQLFPELLGGGAALLITLCFVRYLRTEISWFLLLSGTLIGFIPWLHVRYWMLAVPLFLVIAVFILINKRRSLNISTRIALIAKLAGPSIIPVAILSLIDFHLFGILRPNGGYALFSRSHPDLYPNIHTVLKGLIGLLLDRRVGLLPLTPIYLVAFAGIWPLRKRRWEAAAILVPSIAYLLFVSSSDYWWGSWAPPARYIVAAAILWTPLASTIPINRCDIDFIRALGCWGLVIAAAFTADANFRYFGDPISSNLESALKLYGFDYAALFPSLMRASRADYIASMVWISIALACVFRLNRTVGERA